MGFLNKSAPESDRDWPHDQSYHNICRQCRSEAIPTTPLPMDEVPSRHAPEFVFSGPKRAPSCWKHTHEDTKAWWISKFQAAEMEDWLVDAIEVDGE